MGAQASHTPFPLQEDGKPLSVPWHRTKIPAEKFRELRRVSDFRGAVQSVGWLVMLVAWFALALDCHAKGLRGLTLVFVLLYGMQGEDARVVPSPYAVTAPRSMIVNLLSRWPVRPDRSLLQLSRPTPAHVHTYPP